MRTLQHLLRASSLAALIVALLVGFAAAQQPRGNGPRSSPRQAPKAGGTTSPGQKSGRSQTAPKATRPAPAEEESADGEQPAGPLDQVEADAQACRTAAEAVQVYRIFLASPKLPADVRKGAEKRLAEWVAMEKQEMRRLGKKWITQEEYEATTKKAETMIAHSFELLKIGNYDMAKKELVAASRLNPESGKAEFVMGFVYSLIANNDAKAAVHFAEAVKREPNNAFALNNLAVSEVFLKRYTAAARHFRRALEIMPDLQGVADNVAVSLGLDGQVRSQQIPDDQAAELNELYRKAIHDLGLRPCETETVGANLLLPRAAQETRVTNQPQASKQLRVQHLRLRAMPRAVDLARPSRGLEGRDPGLRVVTQG